MSWAVGAVPEWLEGNEWVIWVAVVAVAIGLGVYLERKRRRELEQAALEMGFAYEADAKNVEPEMKSGLPLLERGALSNLLRGTAGRAEAVVVDCRVGSGKSAVTQTVACFRQSRKKLPTFELRPENVFDRIGAAFGYKDIDFEASPEFSRRYLLRGEDEAGIRLVFHPGLLTFFEQEKGWCVESGANWLAIYRHGRQVRPKEMAMFLQEATRVLNAFIS
ncbi:MAG: hypothetical protein HYY26_07685 [Acidobacteria bacterium]|nr:hypothetical protein [Acidobacteriota bacterium]